MKNIVKNIALFLAAIAAVLSFTSCEPVVSGEFFYSIEPAEDSKPSTSLTWQLDPLGEKLVNKHMAKIAKKISTAWTISGLKKDCDMQVIQALDAAMMEAEADRSYNTLFQLGGITIVVYCGTGPKGESGPTGSVKDFEIYKRTYST